MIHSSHSEPATKRGSSTFPSVLRQLGFLCLGVALLVAPATPASAGFFFSDLAAERNLATVGLGNESFSFGGDSINRFNGALFYSVPLGQTYSVGGSLSYQLRLRYSSNIWHFDTDGPVSASLDSRFDAGAGWSLSFGELIPPSSAFNPSPQWAYRSPAGNLSRFHGSLLDGQTEVPGLFYSRDGSLLRLFIDGSTATVAFPNGIEKVFVQSGNAWQLTEKRDPFGNSISVIHEAGQTRIVDSLGREQKVIYASDPSGNQVIDRVQLTAFGGTVATYQLSYSSGIVDLSSQDTDPATPAQISATFLQSITRPDGQPLHFDYAPTGDVGSGRLASVTLFTGGLLEYDWQIVELPKVAGALHTADVVGIASRTAVGPGSAKGSPSPIGVWTFAMSLDRDRDAATLKPRELTTRITYPDGFARDFKYSAYAGGDPANDRVPPANFYLRDYAFPFSKMNVGPNATLMDSEIVLDAAGQPSMTRRVRFFFGTCAGCWDMHPSKSGSRDLYHDGSGVIETRTSFDPIDMGRYEGARSWDNQGEVPSRTTTFTFDHGTPAPGATWIAAGWASKTITDGVETKRTERCIDGTTGQVTRERILAGPTASANDLLRAHEYHATGERAITRHYGGDVQALGTGALCSLTLPAQEQYAEFWNYQHGSLSGRGFLAADGSVFQQTYSATIDANTGKVASESEADGFLWTYAYDALGRRISATPPAGHGGTSTVVYQPAVGTQNGLTTETVVGADGTELAKTRAEVDAFGRAVLGRRMSDQGWRIVRTAFDAQGRKTSTTGADGGVTEYLGHDAFGRPTTVRPPQGSAYDRTFAYSGRDVSETVKIGKEWNETTNSVVEIARTITTHSDRFGRRLSQTITDADGDSRTETRTLALDGTVLGTTVSDGTITNTHTYPDVTDDRGFVVLTPDGDPITGYDAMGRRSEVDFGQGTVAQVFDRAGRLIEQREGSATGPIWLQNVYAASSVGSDFRGGKLVQATRYNRNVPHLPSSVVTVTDSYAYTGEGGGLETLRTSVEAGSQVIFEFETGQDTSTSGEVSSLTFPDCDPASNDGFSLCQPRVARVMSTERSYGEVVRFFGTVGGTNEAWIDSIVRDSAGRITSTTYGNGLVESRDYAPGSGNRLERLTLSHLQNGHYYDSGDAQYDGLGRLVKLGTQRHVSENAYNLALEPLPQMGDPSGLPTTSVPTDPLGRRTQRTYRVPNAWWASTGVFDSVIETYVYGPGNRLVWNRIFNDYQVANYRKSEDKWYLVDPQGRQVREANSLTYYAGTNPQWSNAEVSSVWMQVDYADDSIFHGGRLLGTTHDIVNAPARTFLHRDFFARRLAESSADGAIEADSSPLF